VKFPIISPTHYPSVWAAVKNDPDFVWIWRKCGEIAKEKQFMIATWIVYDVWVGCGNLREPSHRQKKKNNKIT